MRNIITLHSIQDIRTETFENPMNSNACYTEVVKRNYYRGININLVQISINSWKVKRSVPAGTATRLWWNHCGIRSGGHAYLAGSCRNGFRHSGLVTLSITGPFITGLQLETSGSRMQQAAGPTPLRSSPVTSAVVRSMQPSIGEPEGAPHSVVFPQLIQLYLSVSLGREPGVVRYGARQGGKPYSFSPSYWLLSSSRLHTQQGP